MKKLPWWREVGDRIIIAIGIGGILFTLWALVVSFDEVWLK